jgi:hypothetical protein
VSSLRIAPIVEGHGEVASVPILLRRIGNELLGGTYIAVLPPVRVTRTRIVRRAGSAREAPVVEPRELARAVELAGRKIAAHGDPPAPALVLILLDADEDCPARLAPSMRQVLPQPNIACVLAKVEYETWFVAAAESLTEFLDLGQTPVPIDPEERRLGKPWIQQRFRGPRYSPTIDQPRMTNAMDLRQCRERSPSFDKLCRELEGRLARQ